MGTKAENTRRIRELEKEFDEEEIAEFLRLADDDANRPGGPYRQKRKMLMREIIVAVTLAVCTAGAFFYLISIV